MSLLRYGVEGFRCFRNATDVDLRPLTVLLGKNNSGKSALAGVPLVIGSALKSSSSAPVDLDRVGHDPTVTFLDLLYGRRPHASLSLSLTLATPQSGNISIIVRIQNIDEFQMQVVREFELHSDDVDVFLRWDEADPRAQPLTYNVLPGSGVIGGTKRVTVPFRGLVPDSSKLDQTSFPTKVLTLIDDARSSIDEIRYLGPFRDSPRRSYRTPSDLPAVVGPLGSDAPAILASDFIRGQGDILRRVNTGLSDAASAWELRLDPAATNFALQFVSRVDDSLTVNFADTGVGLSQVLPILVQTARDMEAGPALHPTLNIVEQPELHLHPAAHAGLADLYLASVATGRSRYIIETHSENFVLRVRRRIAEGLDLSCVGLYFIEHDGVEATLNPIPIDSQGRVQNWPHGVFSEDVNEVRAISAARTEPLPQD